MGEARRCQWARGELDVKYHDEEWGVPLRDDRRLFEMLILEGAQAGLSWSTILKKREAYREAFDGFDAAAIARYDARRVARLLRNPGIVRNRLKVKATVINARAFLQVCDEFGAFEPYIWGFVRGRPLKGSPKRRIITGPESDAMSKDLLRRGFKFVGSTICYAYMQAVGMVNDHESRCFRRAEVRAMAAGTA